MHKINLINLNSLLTQQIQQFRFLEFFSPIHMANLDIERSKRNI